MKEIFENKYIRSERTQTASKPAKPAKPAKIRKDVVKEKLNLGPKIIGKGDASGITIRQEVEN